VPWDEPLEEVRRRCRDEIGALDRALAGGELDEGDWYRLVNASLIDAYLASDDPYWQSGFRGDARRWELHRRPVADAIPGDGDFLDVGCANGLLMESVVGWTGARGIAVEPYGLDLSERMAALARCRCAQWADRIWVGNVIGWDPPRRFDFVRTGLEYVPPPRRGELVSRLVERFVAPGGRLLVGTDVADGIGLAGAVAQAGYEGGGEALGQADEKGRRVRLVWVDVPG
jgi:SAM-dependent methyltransferase